MSQQGRYWVFTTNNPENALSGESIEDCSYLIYQLEQGENGTPHYQGYIEFTKKKKAARVRQLLPRSHVEMRKGTKDHAIAYCSKEPRLSPTITWGKPFQSRQGTRTDLNVIRESIESGITEIALAREYFSTWIKYHRAFARYRSLAAPNRTWKSEVVMCLGTPGTGKSRYCLEQCPNAYWKQRSIWWDNYEGQDDVILDDYYGWLPWDVLLRLLDRYPLLVETKGGQAAFLAKRIFITSNTEPGTWYRESPNFSALIRRIDKWMFFYEGGSLECGSYNEIKLLL